MHRAVNTIYYNETEYRLFATVHHNISKRYFNKDKLKCQMNFSIIYKYRVQNHNFAPDIKYFLSILHFLKQLSQRDFIRNAADKQALFNALVYAG